MASQEKGTATSRDTRLNGKRADPKPVKTLPTNRVAFAKQLEVLRAFGAAVDSSGKAVTNVDVAKLVGLHHATVGLITPFFVDLGLLKRTAEGVIPPAEVIAFNQAYKWSPDTAAHRLAPILGKCWFAETLIRRLRFNPLAIDDAIQELALVASAGPSYKGQIGTLIDYLDAAGIVANDGNLIRVSQRSPRAETEQQEESMAPSDAEPDSPVRHSPVATSFANTAAGIVQFNISVKVDMTEFACWEPRRISAFFSGIAQVLAAKDSIEEQTAKP